MRVAVQASAKELNEHDPARRDIVGHTSHVLHLLSLRIPPERSPASGLV